jgi:hypothetical protein
VNIEMTLVNPCLERKDFCMNCNSHFLEVRSSIQGVAVTNHFLRDVKEEHDVTSIISNVLDCSRAEFSELHKFEKNVGGNLIFRAKRGREHIVYAVDKRMRIVFLRAFRNFTEYGRLLENDREILKLIMRAHDVRTKAKPPEEAADDTLKQADKRKKARLRTRGPYRKATTRFDS